MGVACVARGKVPHDEVGASFSCTALYALQSLRTPKVLTFAHSLLLLPVYLTVSCLPDQKRFYNLSQH